MALQVATGLRVKGIDLKIVIFKPIAFLYKNPKNVKNPISRTIGQLG
jgi:hypothetical protein